MFGTRNMRPCTIARTGSYVVIVPTGIEADKRQQKAGCRRKQGKTPPRSGRQVSNPMMPRTQGVAADRRRCPHHNT